VKRSICLADERFTLQSRILGSTIVVVNEDHRFSSNWNELRERVDQLEGELKRNREHEQLVLKTLLSAMSHATAIRESARRDSELTLRKARGEPEERKAGFEREQDEARRELLRLRCITEQTRNGVAAFSTVKMEELQLETEEEPPAGHDAELEPGLPSVVGRQSKTLASPWAGPAPHPRAEVSDPGGRSAKSGSRDDFL
jgi:DivIVA protein